MPSLRTVAVLSGLLLLAIGLVSHRMWTPALADHVRQLGLYLGVVCVLALVLARITGRAPAMFVALIALVPLVHYRGLAPLAATALLLAAAIGLGSLVARSDRHGPLVACMAGLGLIAGSAAWLLPFPVFSAGSLAAALLLVIVLRGRSILDHLRAGVAALKTAHAESPSAALLAAVVLAAASTPAWLPVLMADDLASHLQIPTQLAETGIYRFDVGSQVWSLAPWLTDVCHALVQLLGGKDGVGVLNVAWLAMTALMVQRIGSLGGLSSVMSWLSAALYVSLPLTGALTMSMQTETGSAAAFAALVLVVMRKPPAPDGGTLLLVAMLSAFLLGAKLINLAFIAPPVIWLLWHWCLKVPWRYIPLAAAAVAWIAGSSYTYAWLLSGNPFLPLFNHVFASPWFPVGRWIDDRWLAGLTPALPYALTFRTDAYVEGSPGAAGFALLALVGGVATGLADRRSRPLLLVALAAWILPLTQLQYLRYTQPAMVLLIPALIAGLQTTRQLLLIVTIVALATLQLSFMPAANWVLQHGGLSTLTRAGEAGVLTRFGPERLVAGYQREQLRETDRILIASGPASLAEFGRRAFVANWYDTALHQLVASVEAPSQGWAAAVEYSGASHVLVSGQEDGLLEFLTAARAEPVLHVGEARLYRLPERRTPGVVSNRTADSATVTFDVARDHPALIEARVEIACTQPMAPISYSWNLAGARDREGKDLAHFGWLICGLDGHASAAVALAAPTRSGPLVFDASPVTPGQAGPAEVTANWSEVRRDLATERDLSRRVRSLCPFRFCRIDHARILHTTP